MARSTAPPDRSERRTDARGPCDRERGASDHRAAPAGAAQQRVDVPVAVEPVDERRRDEEEAERDDDRGRDLGEQGVVCPQHRADAGGGQAEQDENHRETGNQRHARRENAASPRALEVGGRDADYRRELSRHERQHARGQERERARCHGGENADAPRRVGHSD